VDCLQYTVSIPTILGITTQERERETIRRLTAGWPLLFHFFSLNGVGSCFRAFSDLTQPIVALSPDVDVRTVIMDSTPGRMHPGVYDAGFAAAMSVRGLTGRAASFVLKPFVQGLLALGKPRYATAQKIVDTLYGCPFRSPTLLLGSERDSVLPHAGFVEYGELLAAKGIPVQSHFWKDSEHIRLYKDHPDEYRALVRAFAQAHLLTGADNRRSSLKQENRRMLGEWESLSRPRNTPGRLRSRGASLLRSSRHSAAALV
jgi:hypothetical protein